MTTPATLREAAARLRQLSWVGSPSQYGTPWTVELMPLEQYGLAGRVLCDGGQGDVTDVLDQDLAEYIAATSPPFALAVADLLSEFADHIEAWGSDEPNRVCDFGAPSDGICRDRANAVAALILGGDQ